MLSNSSNFFKTLFNGGFKESKLNEVEIHTNDELINESSFQKLIDLIYERKLDFSHEDIFHMTVTAQYFQMHEIVDFCEDKIAEVLKSSNVIDVYHFADRYYLCRTKERAFQWMLLRLFPVKCWDQLNFLTLDFRPKGSSNILG